MRPSIRSSHDVVKSLLSSEDVKCMAGMLDALPSPLRLVVTTAELIGRLGVSQNDSGVLRIAVVGASLYAEGFAKNAFWQCLPLLTGIESKIEVVLIGKEADASAWNELINAGNEIAKQWKIKRLVDVTWFGGGLSAAINKYGEGFDLCIWSAPGLGDDSWSGMPMRPFGEIPTAVVSLSVGDAMDDMLACHNPDHDVPSIVVASLVKYLGEANGAPGSAWFIPGKDAVAHHRCIKNYEAMLSQPRVSGATHAQLLLCSSAGLVGNIDGHGDLLEMGLLGFVKDLKRGQLGYLGQNGDFKSLANLFDEVSDEGVIRNETWELMERRIGWNNMASGLTGMASDYAKELSVSAKVLSERFHFMHWQGGSLHCLNMMNA